MPPESKTPYGYCECGCGELAPVSTRFDRAKGYAPGVPKRFILGHHYGAFSPPLIEPTDIDVAWAAGIFDGEGCVQILRHNRGHALSVSVGQSSATSEPSPMLKKLQANYRGYIIENKTIRVATRHHHVWGISGLRAERFLRLIAPYAIQKKTQIAIALEYRANALGRHRYSLADAYVQRLRDERKRL